MKSFAARPFTRIYSIDALRGVVLLLMLLDHVREAFLLQVAVINPMDTTATSPGLFFTRWITYLCAPVFVLLTGLSANLYGQQHAGENGGARRAASLFLVKRGLLFILLEVVLLNLNWSLSLTPSTLTLHALWIQGICMLALAALLWLPLSLLPAVAAVIVLEHNACLELHPDVGSLWFVPWSVLHEHGAMQVGTVQAVISCPALPWIGIITLGFYLGSWFRQDVVSDVRKNRLLSWGMSGLFAVLIIRTLNCCGDYAWHIGHGAVETAMNFFNFTQQPPSLLLMGGTLSTALMVLYILEYCPPQHRLVRWLSTYGSISLVFYLLHLGVLKVLKLLVEKCIGVSGEQGFGLSSTWPLWVMTAVLAVSFYPFVQRLAHFKANRKETRWMRYL